MHSVHGVESPDIIDSLEYRGGAVYSNRLADFEQMFKMPRWIVKWKGKILHDSDGPTIDLSIAVASAQAEIEAIQDAATISKNEPKPKKFLKFRKFSKRINFPCFEMIGNDSVAAGMSS